jgi:hypothetical protein
MHIAGNDDYHCEGKYPNVNDPQCINFQKAGPIFLIVINISLKNVVSIFNGFTVNTIKLEFLPPIPRLASKGTITA